MSLSDRTKVQAMRGVTEPDGAGFAERGLTREGHFRLKDCLVALRGPQFSANALGSNSACDTTAGGRRRRFQHARRTRLRGSVADKLHGINDLSHDPFVPLV